MQRLYMQRLCMQRLCMQRLYNYESKSCNIKKALVYTGAALEFIFCLLSPFPLNIPAVPFVEFAAGAG